MPNYAVRHYAPDAAIFQIGDQPFGVTLGGITVVPGPIFRVLEGDGLTTEVQNTRRPVGWDTHIRFRLKDFSPEVMELLSPGGSSDGSSPNNAITPAPARTPFSEEQYLEDVRVLIKVIDPATGDVTWDAFVLGRGVIEPWTQSGEDSNEHAREVDIKGVIPAGMPTTTCPYVEIEDYDENTFDVNDYFTL